MSSAYEQVKRQVDTLEQRFYGLLDACDDYAELLDRLSAEERGRHEPNPELVRRYGHQHEHADELREQLESAPMDTLLRIVDRILMIKETEEGRFL